MEAAAMTAYLKDIQNNADLTSQVIIYIFILYGYYTYLDILTAKYYEIDCYN